MQRKPLKRHKALVPLSKDHHFGLLLCFKIRTGLQKEVEEERIARYARYFFRKHLLEHFRLEEELIFPCLAQENPLRKEAEKQHQELYELEKQLDGPSSEIREVLIIFEDKLEKHIRLEERQLFMQLQDELDEVGLQSLGERVEAKHQFKPEVWQDRFWE